MQLWNELLEIINTQRHRNESERLNLDRESLSYSIVFIGWREPCHVSLAVCTLNIQSTCLSVNSRSSKYCCKRRRERISCFTKSQLRYHWQGLNSFSLSYLTVKMGFSALHYAVMCLQPRMCDLLLMRGCSVNNVSQVYDILGSFVLHAGWKCTNPLCCFWHSIHLFFWRRRGPMRFKCDSTTLLCAWFDLIFHRL